MVGEHSGPVNLQVGQLLEVRLPVQAGTGYSWNVAPDISPNLEFAPVGALVSLVSAALLRNPKLLPARV